MAAIRLDSIALAAAALTLAAPALHVDADGDGFADSVALSHGRLVVATRTSVLSTPVPQGARLNGALHVRGLAGSLLLVRIGPRDQVTDAVYRVAGATLRRVHVHGAADDGLVQGGGSATVLDFDCGDAPLTVEQIAARPDGGRWDETVLTYALDVRGLVLRQIRRITVSARAAATRRCEIVRR
jgi:hypothetical protein